MKTFSEYIGESKQNYIFGGTDDRNTDTYDDSPVKFSELKAGHMFYKCCVSRDNGKVYLYAGEFEKMTIYNGIVYILYDDITSDTKGGSTDIPKSKFDLDSYVNIYNQSIYTTNKDILIDTVKRMYDDNIMKLLKEQLKKLE